MAVPTIPSPPVHPVREDGNGGFVHIDPVCGMTVDPAERPWRTDHAGVTARVEGDASGKQVGQRRDDAGPAEVGVAEAVVGHAAQSDDAEVRAEQARDRAYWEPLRKELEQFRFAERKG